jgi:hypothetical protein
MAWSISHTTEAWENARHNLFHWRKCDLVDALYESESQIIEQYPDRTKLKKPTGITILRTLPKDILIDSIIEMIGIHNTCSNGGYEFYIDPEGWYSVAIEQCKKKNCQYT